MEDINIDISGLNISEDLRQLILSSVAGRKMFGLTVKDAGSSVIFVPSDNAAIVLPRKKDPYIIHFTTDLDYQRTIQLTILVHRIFVPMDLLDVFRPLQLFISSQNNLIE